MTKKFYPHHNKNFPHPNPYRTFGLRKNPGVVELKITE